MRFLPSTPINPTGKVNSSWNNNINAADHGAAEYSTGIGVHVVNASAGSVTIGVRKKGSKDTSTQLIAANSHLMLFTGLNPHMLFQVYCSNWASVSFYPTVFFGSEAVFFTNPIDKPISQTAIYEPCDISADTGADTAIMGIFRHNQSSNPWAAKHPDSTLDLYYPNNYIGDAVVGLKAEVASLKAFTTGASAFKLVGYIKSGVTVNAQPTNISLGSINTLLDFPALPAGALGGIYEIPGTGGGYNWLMRKKGSIAPGDNTFLVGRHAWMMIEGDANRLVEGEIANIGIDQYLHAVVTDIGLPQPYTTYGNVMYVDPNPLVGDDNHGTGEITAPFRTLAVALNIAYPGDTIYLRAGTYDEPRATVTNVATADAPITVQPYPGEVVSVSNGLRCVSSQYIKAFDVPMEWVGGKTAGEKSLYVDSSVGCEFYRCNQSNAADYEGVKITGTCQGCFADDYTTTGGTAGDFGTSTQNNIISGAHSTNINAAFAIAGTGNTIENSIFDGSILGSDLFHPAGANNVVKGCRAYNFLKPLGGDQHVDIFQVTAGWGSPTGLVIRECILGSWLIREADSDADPSNRIFQLSVESETCNDWLLQNNIFLGSRYYIMTAGGVNPISGWEWYNNLFYSLGWNNDGGPHMRDWRFKNCIFISAPPSIAGDGTFQSDYNIYINRAIPAYDGGHSIRVDGNLVDLFRNPDITVATQYGQYADWRPKGALLTALRQLKGVSGGNIPTTDLAGRPRPANPTIGPYELPIGSAGRKHFMMQRASGI